MQVIVCCVLMIAAPVQRAGRDDAIDVVTALETAVADAIEKVQPSVVAITRIPNPNGETLAIRDHPQAPQAIAVGMERPGFPNLGSPNDPTTASVEAYPLPGDFGGGVVIGDKGQILTTYQMVKGAKQLRVRAQAAVFEAEIIAADPRSDLAVIVPKATAVIDRPLPAVPLGKAEESRQGSFLIALGNPYNAARDGKASASLGILSNMARKFDPPVDENFNIRRLFRFQPTLMQLDSRLNLGMSGGAVINLKGQLVGISTNGASPVGYDAAAGYAIPMDVLGRRAVEALIQGKEVEYSFIGIGLGTEPNTVSQVQHGTPAMLANLMTGDRILAVGGQTLADDESALPLALALVPVGEPVGLKVLRNGSPVDLTIVMSKYPVMDSEGVEVIATNRPAPWRGAQIDFASMLGDGQDTAATLAAMGRGGVGVMDVNSGSSAESVGLVRGAVITAVDGKTVRTPREFREAVARFDGKPVDLTIAGRGEVEGTRKVTVPPG